MRKKILPLLTLFILTGSCVKQQKVETTPEVTPAQPAKEEIVTEETTPLPEKTEKLTKEENKEVQLLRSFKKESPELKVINYFAEKEVNNFQKLLKAKVYNYIPKILERNITDPLYVERRPEKLRLYIRDSLIFDINRATIINYNFLHNLSQALKETDKTIVIAAFTDNSGTDSFNYQLTEERVKKLKLELSKSGIPETQILTFSCGSNNPVAPNTTVEGRKENRRVEIYIYPKNTEIENICRAGR